MNKKVTLSAILILLTTFSYAQFWQQNQYFDGADTVASSIKIQFDTTHHFNIWQIGKPQKTIFNSATTVPNALITDTMNYYPKNDTSVFWFASTTEPWGIHALRWKQKLDFEKHHSGGMVEFSIDKGTTWQNTFNNPISHNFYGFDNLNKDTLLNGNIAFSGTDTTWKDIWFCIYNFNQLDTVYYRFTLISDTSNSLHEGWMLDNIFAHTTIKHIVKENEKSKYLKVYPTATSGSVNIEALLLEANQEIESIELFGIDGRLIKQYGVCPSKFSVNLDNLPNGQYYLKVNTNLQKEVFPIILTK
ncbi:MAG: hypothetical protein RIQ33_965 [Bacteroidota bacterium]|jgi:hypothetical protein